MNYSKNKWGGGALVLGFGLLGILTSLDNSKEEKLEQHYVDHPPIPSEFYVQKVQNGSQQAVALHVKLEHDLTLPEVITLYDENGEPKQYLKDDGRSPDLKAGDRMYSTVVDQSPEVFVEQLLQRENRIMNRGYSLSFKGHNGRILHSSEIRPFDQRRFDLFDMVPLGAFLLEGANTCDQDENTIKKQNSLLITDLAVVEDEARTYNVVENDGAPQGAWTFGTLIKNMAGGYADESSPTTAEIIQVREFIKQWIIQLSTTYTVNGIQSPPISHSRVFETIPIPWIKKALGITTNIPSNNSSGWISYWDTIDTPEEMSSLLANAPFKLTAIVNRIDLRGNSSYSVSSGSEPKAGETRFVYSLIQILNEPTLGNAASDIGKPIFHDDVLPSSQRQLIDWQGMNVILEYKNMQMSACAVRTLGNQWKALSEMNMDPDIGLGNHEYLSALEAITNKVTKRNANPNGTNGSAISQVRTNTKLFRNVTGVSDWTNFNWNLREFGLDETTGLLVNQATANMPFATNNIRSLSENQSGGSSNPDFTGSSEDIVDWIYGVNGPSHKNAVLAGNHKIPQDLLNPTSEMEDEQQSYFDLGFWDASFPNSVYDHDNYMGGSSADEKEIRHQLSLNSCLGCHGAETKTMFTMIRPLGYEQAADYWSDIPSTTTGLINNFAQFSNLGYTNDPFHKDADNSDFIPNYEQSYYEGAHLLESRTVPNVSPFLTGRNYRGTSINSNKRWDDDNESLNANHPDEASNGPLNDKSITGLFYVNDPANNSNGTTHLFPQLHDKKYGYNELENRQMDLCQLISSPCGGQAFSVIDLASQINFIPLPLHGH